MNNLLVPTLLQPERVTAYSTADYNLLIPQARSCGLLATLSALLQERDLMASVPPEVARHMESALLLHHKQVQDLDYELRGLKSALGERLILLKGAAYLTAGVSSGQGRVQSDIDILVPRHSVSAVERSLNEAGWVSADLDPYNERYYRTWMHEIPPMGNLKRGVTLDIHHTILPPTAAPNVDASLLFDDPVEVRPDVFVLAPADMLIHSATHLFHEGEFKHGLRDLWDLDRMLRQFPAEQGDSFWDALLARAQALDLETSLFHGLTYTRRVFSTPVPEEAMTRLARGGRRLRRPLMDFLFARAFNPPQPECTLRFTGLALEALYIRSHYLRMPLHLLLPHLARKAWMSRRPHWLGVEQTAK